MKKSLAVVLLLLVVVAAGCAKKEDARTADNVQLSAAHKMLVEGTVFLKQGDPLKAAELFAASIKAAPDQFDGYFMLGDMFINLKQYPQAVAVMTSAVHQFPNNGLAYYLLALAHQGADQKLPAIVAARRSVELFNAAQDTEGVKRSSVLLAVLIQAAKQEAADQAVANAASDAQKAVQDIKVPVSVTPPSQK